MPHLMMEKDVNWGHRVVSPTRPTHCDWMKWLQHLIIPSFQHVVWTTSSSSRRDDISTEKTDLTYLSSTTAQWNIFNFTKTRTVSYLNLFWNLTTCTTEITLHTLAVIFTCCWFHFKLFEKFSVTWWVTRWVSSNTGWQWNWHRFVSPNKSKTPVNVSIFHWIWFNTLKQSTKF